MSIVNLAYITACLIYIVSRYANNSYGNQNNNTNVYLKKVTEIFSLLACEYIDEINNAAHNFLSQFTLMHY